MTLVDNGRNTHCQVNSKRQKHRMPTEEKAEKPTNKNTENSQTDLHLAVAATNDNQSICLEGSRKTIKIPKSCLPVPSREIVTRISQTRLRRTNLESAIKASMYQVAIISEFVLWKVQLSESWFCFLHQIQAQK